MKKIKVNFVDFWDNFKKDDNYFYHLLSQKYQVIIDEQAPDILFFSVDYAKNKERDKYVGQNCKKVFFTGENVSANFFFPGSIEYDKYSIGKADYSFTFEKNKNLKNYRLPLWVMFINWFNVPHRDERDISYLIPLEQILNREPQKYKKTKFCNFVFSNNSGLRLEILNHLQQYKKVDCAGKLANNIGFNIQGRGDQRFKIDFLSQYKFTIAAENTKNAGYTTEKIIHPLSIGSIPIYWGSETVSEDFNKESFINVDNFHSLKDLTEYVKFVDNNKDAYEEIISKPIFKDNKIPENFLPENILNYFEENILC